MKRHRFAVAAAASAAVLSIGFAAAMGVQSQRIANFMKGMLKVSDPSEARGNSITAREILDNGSKDGNAGSSLAVIWFQLGSNEGPLNRRFFGISGADSTVLRFVNSRMLYR